MAKRIVFCADGTWDGAGGENETQGANPSNVLKLFNLLAGALSVGTPTDPEQERQSLPDGNLGQIAKYIHGVGNSSNWLVQKMGGGVGTGLIARVLRGYTFISRNHQTCDPPDAIFLNGFSRGAYTARALGGFISTMGLLDWRALNLNPNASDPMGYQYAAAAWYDYQQRRLSATRSPNWLSRLQSFVACMPELAPAFVLKPRYVSPVRIAAIAVWETVGALGIPELTPDQGARLDLLRFVDTALSTNVVHGIHAIAADEQRVDFTATLWDPDPRVTQCFFPGAHADVGGGYPSGQSQLSDMALGWMVSALQSTGTGVQFSATPAPMGSSLGPMHMPWTSAGFSIRPKAWREFPAYGGPGAPIQISPGLRQRLRQTVPCLTDTVPPATQPAPYVPVALVNAGYVDIGGITARP